MKSREKSTAYGSVGEEFAYNLLEYLYQGGRNADIIREIADSETDGMIRRIDCSDFRVCFHVRVLYTFGDVLPADVRAKIEDVLLDFPYADCGGHAMCTWTENHRLYSDGSEYLLAQLYPERTFGDGQSAAYHLERARRHLITWTEHIERFGFSEWGSVNYYPETLAGLTNLVQFARDDEVAGRARRITDLLLYDVFSRLSVKGGYVFNPACARAYVDNKISSRHGNYLNSQIGMLLGRKYRKLREKEACVMQLVEAVRPDGSHVYVLPEKIRKLLDKPVRETAMREGLNVSDYRKYGLAGYSEDNVRYALQSGAVSDRRLIANHVRYMKETGLIEGELLKPLSAFAKPILYRTGLLGFIKRFVSVVWDASSMEEGNVYTYATDSYSVSAAFDYHVGKPSFQQNSLAINVSPEISLFAQSPFKDSEKTGSPDYWIGSAVSPRAYAYRNVAMCVFDTSHARYGLKFTHLFFPTGLFDELDLSGLEKGVLLGRSCGVNVCVHTNPGVMFRPAGESAEHDMSLRQDEKVPEDAYNFEYDLINKTGDKTYYVFELEDTMSFEEFKRHAAASGAAYDSAEKALLFRNGVHDYELRLNGGFFVDGEKFEPEFVRPSQGFDRL